jgi:DNA invertase Pin-like site-specific DNA recombinase
MDVIGYLRVSTAEQAASGYGLKAQEAAIRETAKRKGWKLVELIRDRGESGKSLQRPGLRDALEQLAAGDAEGLVVAKLDRLSRSVVDFGSLLDWFAEAEAVLVALDFDIDTSTPGGRLVANVLMSVAEWERDTIAARTSAGLAAARADGKAIGPAAVSDRPELRRRIQQLRDKGLSLRAIAEKLNADGIQTLRGGREWRVSSVQTVLGYKRPTRRRRGGALPAIKRKRTGRPRAYR